MTHTAYFTVATAGHVDHGKTSVLRALTGIDPDRLKEEKERQMTTDLGFAHLRLQGNADEELIVGFIDVPGHGKFIKNMLAGVGGIDMALLVVAADEGPMPQTVAHVKILSLLGVTKALVVLTKTDLANEQMQTASLARVAELLKRYSLEELAVVRVACPSQVGFGELKKTLQRTLIANVNRNGDGEHTTAYLPIDRVFSKSGHGLVVTGTLVRGSIKTGDNVFIEPGNLKARVRGLETFGRTLSSADSGQRLAVNLSVREHASLKRGQTILGEHLTPSSLAVVKIVLTQDSDDAAVEQTLTGQQVRLYHGTAECAGHMRWLERIDDALVGQITLNDPAVAEAGDRFVLRYGDTGISGGIILLTARPRWLTRPKLLEVTQALVSSDYRKAVSLFLDACPQRVVRPDTINCMLPQSARQIVVEQLMKEESVQQLAHYLVTSESIRFLSGKLTGELARIGSLGSADAENHTAARSLETVRGKVLPGIDRTVFQALVKWMSDAGTIQRKGDQLFLPSAQGASEKQSVQKELEDKIVETLSQHWCLEIDELASQVRQDKKVVTAALNQLSKEMKATVINYEFAGLSTKVNDAHKLLAQIWQAKKDISPSDFRDALSTSRKYAMALLAFFDDRGVTRRVGNSRVLLKNPKAE